MLSVCYIQVRILIQQFATNTNSKRAAECIGRLCKGKQSQCAYPSCLLRLSCIVSFCMTIRRILCSCRTILPSSFPGDKIYMLMICMQWLEESQTKRLFQIEISDGSENCAAFSIFLSIMTQQTSNSNQIGWAASVAHHYSMTLRVCEEHHSRDFVYCYPTG